MKLIFLITFISILFSGCNSGSTSDTDKFRVKSARYGSGHEGDVPFFLSFRWGMTRLEFEEAIRIMDSTGVLVDGKYLLPTLVGIKLFNIKGDFHDSVGLSGLGLWKFCKENDFPVVKNALKRMDGYEYAGIHESFNSDTYRFECLDWNGFIQFYVNFDHNPKLIIQFVNWDMDHRVNEADARADSLKLDTVKVLEE